MDLDFDCIYIIDQDKIPKEYLARNEHLSKLKEP